MNPSNPTVVPSTLRLLSQWMAGEFSNAQQAFDHPQQFAHIHVFFRPLPLEFFNGVGFYSEQVYDYDLWNPYRQGIHRLVEEENQVYIENYGLKDPMLYAGSARELSILKTITPDCIERRWNCSMVFRPEGAMRVDGTPERFTGQVEGTQCLIPRNGRQTYLVSEVVLTESTWMSLDKGLDLDSHESIWGSEHGPLCFQKIQDFSHELPAGL